MKNPWIKDDKSTAEIACKPAAINFQITQLTAGYYTELVYFFKLITATYITTRDL